MGVIVAPWLSTNTVGEVRVSATNGQVHDQVELSVERSSVGLTNPWVGERFGEFSALEERLGLEIYFEDLVFRFVEIGVESILIPVETIDMESFVERLGVLEPLSCLIEFVLIIVGAPVES